MNQKALAIVPIVAFIAVILFVGAAIGVLTPILADAKIGTKHIRLDAIGQGLPAAEAPSGPSDPPAFGPNCVGCITTLNLANGAITHPKIAPHSVDQTQLTFAIHNGTNGAIGPQGPVGPQGPPGTLPVQEYVTFNSCGGTNGNHNVQCSIHIEGTSATTLTCTVANPAISGGDNTGDCQTDTSLHLSCVIPPATGPFLCSRLS